MRIASNALKIGAAAIMATSCLSGCTEALRRDVYESCRINTRDDYWLNTFHLQECDAMKAKAHLACSGWFISLEQINIARKTSFDGGLVAMKRDHMNFDPTADEVGKLYIQAAKSRGSVVKMYRPGINKKLIKIVSFSGAGALGYNETYSKFSDWDFALIEFSLDGRMLSALSRQQQIYTNASPYLQDMFSVIIYDSGIRILEQNVGNMELANEFVRDV